MTQEEKLKEIKISDIVYHVYCSEFMTYDIEEMYVIGGSFFPYDGRGVMFDLQSTKFPERKAKDSAENIFKTIEEAQRRAKELQRDCGHRIITEKEYQEFTEWKLSKEKK